MLTDPQGSVDPSLRTTALKEEAIPLATFNAKKQQENLLVYLYTTYT